MGLEYIRAANVHLKWVIEEYLRILRRDLCLKPVIEPTIALIVINISIIFSVKLLRELFIKITKGPIFWGISNNLKDFQDKPITIDGNHW